MMSIEQILRKGDKLNGSVLTISGRLVLDIENSILEDDSSCKGIKVARCMLWVSIGKCQIAGGPFSGRECGSVLRELFQKQTDAQANLTTLTVDKVRLHGRLLTKRRDITYAKGVPQSAKVGFGHLSAYPAQITVDQIEMSTENTRASPARE